MSENSKAGLRRLASILKPGGPLPISKSAWWAGVKSGVYPAPVKLGPRTTCWRDADIQQLVENGIGTVGAQRNSDVTGRPSGGRRGK
jgi:prophage regulatory protein